MADDYKLDLSGIETLLRTEPQKGGRWLTGVAETIVSDIILSMDTSPPGKSHTRGNVTHVASQPGYPPNTDIGKLVGSIRQENTGSFERTISAGTEYALPLEEGSEHLGGARPFMEPAINRARGWIEEDAHRNLGLEDGL